MGARQYWARWVAVAGGRTGKGHGVSRVAGTDGDDLRLIETSPGEHEPLFVSDSLGVVRALNGPGRRAVEARRGVFLAADGRLCFVRSDDLLRFDHLMSDLNYLTVPGPASVAMRFSVAGEPDPNTIVVSRVRKDLEFESSNTYAIVVHYRLEAFQTAPDNLCDVFELTPAEEQVAKAIIQGKALKQCAQSQGNSVETIRWHVKNVLSKSGCSTQAEFVSLALSMTRRTA
jgi:DNA-binding CsgD family transcriptional regulator